MPRDDVAPLVLVRDGFTVVLGASLSCVTALVTFLTGNVRFGSELRRGIVTVVWVVLSVVPMDVVAMVGDDKVDKVRTGYTRCCCVCCFTSPSSTVLSFFRRLKLARKRLNL